MATLTYRKIRFHKFKWIMVMFTGSLVFSCTDQKIDFNTEVKPILNNKCIHCHGGVKESGGFSLITRELALRENDSGEPAIIPGDANSSELTRRIQHSDPEERMPYDEEPLTESEIELLKTWIDQGANWDRHWAYQPVANPDQEVINQSGSVFGSTDLAKRSNPIDNYIIDKIEEKGLSPSPEEDKSILIRRLSLDIIGLPPPADLTNRYIRGSLSYDEVVDSLLASKHYGEKWASMWMDLARYADSKGFERDASRNIWMYRDYVIRAFNRDLAYDQFITEQLAGDLLPNPTDEQYIATGFHRNTTTNDEGGTDNEEYRVAAVIDRVNTTWQAFLGTTFSCVQCHGHPYDPFFHEDYYKSFAFFNNTRDYDTHPDYPIIRSYNEGDTEKLNRLVDWVGSVDSENRAQKLKTFLKTWQPIIYSIECDQLSNAALYDTKYLGFRKNGVARMTNVELNSKDRLLTKVLMSKGGSIEIRQDDPKGKLLGTINLPVTTQSVFLETQLSTEVGTHDIYYVFKDFNTGDKDELGVLIDWFHFTKSFPGDGSPQRKSMRSTFWELMDAEVESSLIMYENPPDRKRDTYLFDRGNWLTPTGKVEPGVPEIFDFSTGDLSDRLDLANWITNPKNPLTARTMVNRIWEQLFGVGLVETTEDFGTQGTPPSHPKLLDWLAWKYMYDLEWSNKDLIRLIVNSSTYKQTSRLTDDHTQRDPDNRLYARGPRIRLSAEQLRDQALYVSGLLNSEMYGPPVMPYQPEGVWQTPYNNEKWSVSQGESRHRRALYTFMKRSSPYPSMETFDLSARQVCVSRRIRTNTPLQALVTLNDPVFIEAANALARQMLKSDSSLEKQIRYGYEAALGREITEDRLTTLMNLYLSAQSEFSAENPNQDDSTPDMESAAMTLVANTIMNLDEFLMK